MWLERTRNAAIAAFILVALEAVAILAVFTGPAPAHEAPPVAMDVTPIDSGRLGVRIELDARRFLAAVEGVDHDTYAELPLPEAAARLNDQPEELTGAVAFAGPQGPLAVATKGIDAAGGLDLVVFEVAGLSGLDIILSEAVGYALVRVLEPTSGEVVQTVFAVPGERTAITLAQGSEQSAFSVAGEYLVAGFDHILPKGLDHILFVIGLFLLSPAIRPLLVQVSLFTVAHTTTLGLAAAGLITVPSVIVEPLIAASIAFIAIENVFRSSLSRWRPFVIFGFGLLHGLGFASVLADFGLPAEQFAVALAAFNLGVEAGQVTVLALCFLAFGLFFGRPWYRRAISIPASLALAGVGLYWFVERVAGSMA